MASPRSVSTSPSLQEDPQGKGQEGLQAAGAGAGGDSGPPGAVTRVGRHMTGAKNMGFAARQTSTRHAFAGCPGTNH